MKEPAKTQKQPKLVFYVRRESITALLRDARFVPRTQYIKVGDKFDDEIGVWLDSDADDVKEGIPVRLIDEEMLWSVHR